EDGIRDKLVTGVQTCALPISSSVAQDPFGRLTGWRSRIPPLPHLGSLPRSRLELHALSITTVQDPRRPFAYSEDVTRDDPPGRRSEERRVGKECRAGWAGER